MEISQIITKMIIFSKGNLHDINHFMKVYAFAKLIGESENLDKNTQNILETAAILHDIACPVCRKNTEILTANSRKLKGCLLFLDFLKILNPQKISPKELPFL